MVLGCQLPYCLSNCKMSWIRHLKSFSRRPSIKRKMSRLNQSNDYKPSFSSVIWEAP